MTTDKSPIITLLTDFGDRDGYVGTMKGVILGIAPDAQIVDISHQITPQDIHQAAIVLSDAYTYFPPHTVHLVVVDPGVGSQRNPIALQTPRGYFVAPDNGVLTYITLNEPDVRAIRLTNPRYWLPNPSNTFHGRDIFSPAAAYLAQGTPFEELGQKLESITTLDLPQLTISPSAIRGEVVHIDRFGNVLTNIMHLQWIDDQTLELNPRLANNTPAQSIRLNAQTAHVTCGWQSLKGIHRTYSEVPPGHRVALIGSEGELEIAVNQGNASETMAIKVGDPVTIQIAR